VRLGLIAGCVPSQQKLLPSLLLPTNKFP